MVIVCAIRQCYFTIDKTNQLSGMNAAKVVVSTTQMEQIGTFSWRSQVRQLVAGTKYTVTFSAKASTSRLASVALQLGASPYTTIFIKVSHSVQLQQFAFDLWLPTSVTNITVLFNLAKKQIRNHLHWQCTSQRKMWSMQQRYWWRWRRLYWLDSDCNSCEFVGQNLVTNGDFEAGNSGFISDYAYTSPSLMCGNWGIYSIVKQD